MQSTNGHGPKRAILYARVSTDEQAKSGFSLAQQMEALREYAAREGYEILEEVSDPGQSGASLERPGMDRVRDLVAAGGVSVVLAQDRDRFAREPAYHYLLQREFEGHGCRIRALNDRGDDSPEGQLTDGIMDQIAKFERAKIAERTRRGKLRRAREGKIVPGRLPDYGFKYNATRDNYEVDEHAMRVVKRIFSMVGKRGMSLHAVKRTFEREGVKTPTGRKYWGTQVIRRFLLDDVYRPHTYEELEELVTPEVASRLNRSKCYGIWWFNVRRARATQIAEVGPNGRNYRRKVKTTTKPKSEWIAVPVPNSGILRSVVDAAREAIQDNRSPSLAGHRFWELSGGIFYCGGCGCAMNSHTVRKQSGDGYHYYLCSTIMRHGKDACSQNRNIRADKVEPAVWGFVSGLLKEPNKVRAGLEAMIEQEYEGLRGDPEQDTRVWLEKLAEVDEMRGNYQEMAARGLITFDELGAKLQEQENTRKTAVRELEAVESRRERIKALEQDKDTLMESYAGMVPEALDVLSTEERRQIYKMLRLKVAARGGEKFEVRGILGNVFSTLEPTPRSSAISTQAGNARRP